MRQRDDRRVERTLGAAHKRRAFQALEAAFVDPGVQFGLNFQTEPEEEPGQRKRPSIAGGKSHDVPAEKPAAPAEVVSLDSFRKK